MVQLDARERAVLRLRFVDGLTQSEIAEAVGTSQMHVSRLLTSGLQKLRDGIGETEGQIADEIGR
jgi:RNA polymerase sigma-B factor